MSIVSNASFSNGDHRNLIVWQKSMTFAVDIARLAKKLPRDERYELARQMKGAALSIPANIAEGKGRMRRADYARFVSIARGSARELDAYFEYARRLGYLSAADTRHAEQMLDEIARMLTALLRRLNPIYPPAADLRPPT